MMWDRGLPSPGLIDRDMSQEQKALEILRALADTTAAGNGLTAGEDWGLGSGTLINGDGAHTHFGCNHGENTEESFDAFVNGLHDLLVEKHGLSWVKPSSAAASNDLEFPIIRMGLGEVEVGDASYEGLPALWFGRGSRGLDAPVQSINRSAHEGETLALFTFADIRGLEAIEAACARVRTNMSKE